jgi:hypothetical protein
MPILFLHIHNFTSFFIFLDKAPPPAPAPHWRAFTGVGARAGQLHFFYNGKTTF